MGLDRDKIVRMWLSSDHKYGIVEMDSDVLDEVFYPVMRVGERGTSYEIINGMWFTSYRSARDYFSKESNRHVVYGRLKEVDEFHGMM